MNAVQQTASESLPTPRTVLSSIATGPLAAQCDLRTGGCVLPGAMGVQ